MTYREFKDRLKRDGVRDSDDIRVIEFDSAGASESFVVERLELPSKKGRYSFRVYTAWYNDD